MKSFSKKVAIVFVVLVAFLTFACKSTPKVGNLRAEYRYTRSNANEKGYTFYRFFQDNTFSRGAGGEAGKQSGEIETERGTYIGDPTANGTITLTVTSTFNMLNNQWLSITEQHEAEPGTISGSTLLLNGITYLRQ